MPRSQWHVRLLAILVCAVASAACMVDFTPPADLCAGEDCGGHGTCEVGAEGPVCDCDPGWAEPGCDACAAGYHDEGGACVVDESCGPDTCSGHGQCDDSSGVTSCTRDEGHEGDDCLSCADGYQDHDGDGACTPACGSVVAPECTGEHQRCDDVTGQATCVCVEGYAFQGGACVWIGGPLDPGFQQTDLWTADATALVDNSAPGAADSGEGQFSQEAVCSLGSIEQSFGMPAYADAEPLQLQFNARNTNSFMCDNLAVVIDGRWTRVFLGTDWTAVSLCLGERAYGGTSTLRFTPYFECIFCSFNMSLVPAYDLDNVYYVPDVGAECPLPGEVKNGDFEAGTLDWVDGTGNNGVAEVAPGVGSGGSLAGRLVTAGRCDSASLTGAVSVPSSASLPQPALEILADGTDGQALQILLQNLRVGSIPGNTGFPQIYHVCLPSAHHGMVRDLRLRLEAPGGTCADPYVQNFVFDDLSVVTEPACPTDAHLVDPGFELALANPTLAQPWHMTAPSTGNGSVSILSAPVEARTGLGVLRMVVASPCSAAEAETSFTVPFSDANGGPALRFWYRAAVIDHGNLRSTPGNGNLPAAANWTQETVCLDPRWVGQAHELTFTRNAGSGTCANTYPDEITYIDDLEVTTDPSCPVQ